MSLTIVFVSLKQMLIGLKLQYTPIQNVIHLSDPQYKKL